MKKDLLIKEQVINILSQSDNQLSSCPSICLYVYAYNKEDGIN